ncbi:MAG: DUF4340 domain-containing protein [Myxococcota bacterium]
MNQIQKSLLTGAVFVALAGGAAGLAYWDKKSRQGESERKEKEKLAFDLKADDIQKVDVTNAQVHAVAERTAEGWKLTEPMVAPADDAIWTGMATALANLRLRTRFAEGELDPATVGLSAPETTVSVTTKDGKTYQLHAGNKSPFDDGQYVRAGEDAAKAPVAVTVSYNLGAFQKSLFEMREKRLITEAATSIDALEVLQKQPTDDAISFKVTREGEAGKHKYEDGWKLVTPVAAPGDREELGKVAGNLTGLKALAFVDETAAELARWNLVEPDITVKLNLAGTERTLLFGKVESGGVKKHYAKRADVPNVAEVSETDFNSLRKDLFTLRDKRLLDFDRDLVTTISATLPGGGKLTLVKSLADGGGTEVWRVSEPKDAPARAWKATSLLYTLANFKMKRFVKEGVPSPAPADLLATYGLDKPMRTVLLQDGKGGELVTFLFGREEGGEVFVMAKGGTSVGAVDAKRLEDLPQSADEFSDEPIQALGAKKDGGAAKL